MEHEMMSMGDLLGGRVISVNPPKCDNCRNDAAGTECAKVDVYGGRLCIARGGRGSAVSKHYVAPCMVERDGKLLRDVFSVNVSSDPSWDVVLQGKDRGFDVSDVNDGNGWELWDEKGILNELD